MPSGFTLTKKLRHEDNHAQRLFTYAPSLREAPPTQKSSYLGGGQISGLFFLRNQPVFPPLSSQNFLKNQPVLHLYSAQEKEKLQPTIFRALHAGCKVYRDRGGLPRSSSPPLPADNETDPAHKENGGLLGIRYLCD